ncbi:MAG: NAD(P)/FAD-dependent oxidoreductase, partial [Oscillospiraceae bacterium]
AARLKKDEIESITISKSSVDARKQDDIKIVMSVVIKAKVNEEVAVSKANSNDVKYCKSQNFQIQQGTEKLETRPVVVGFGPSGMFSALLLAKKGYKPIVIERGSKIDERVGFVKNFWENAVLNTETNVQFGEGGAGTFSDGKLTTRISDERCSFVLEEMVRFGATEDILTKAKPHIGTDKLRLIVKNIREEIISLGGEVRFNEKLLDIKLSENKVKSVVTTKDEIPCENVILAIGHSARDTFEMLCQKEIFMEPKGFSVGVRIEHLQEDINFGLYGKHKNHEALPVGEYQLSKRIDGRGVYTFCMCPGGFVVPSASEENTVVTNGMSEYNRSQKNANAAVVVEVNPKDFGNGILDGVNFQRRLEKAAFLNNTACYKAPVQTVGKFINDQVGAEIKRVQPSYEIGVKDGSFKDIFPSFVTEMMKIGIKDFGRKIKGYDADDALMTGVETRTSSPIRITRGGDMQSISVQGLYPSGEGAGYAGGIMSAAVDGLRVAQTIIERYAPME